MKQTTTQFFLIVLLALTFGSACKTSSNEAIRALVIINEGLLEQKLITEKANDRLMAQFASEVVTNPHDQKRKDLNDKAIMVAKKSKELNDFMEDLKIEMVAITDGVKPEEAKKRVKNPFEVQQKSNSKKPYKFLELNKSDNDEGKAHELKVKLQSFKEFLLNIVTTPQSYHKKMIGQQLEIFDLDSSKGKRSSWEKSHFYLPLSGVLTELTRWQYNVREAESTVLNHLFQQISATTFKFGGVSAAIVPESYVVESGSTFEAEVFLQAYTPHINPIITYGSSVDTVTWNVVNGARLEKNDFTSDGRGHIRIPVGSVGEKNIEGVISIVHPATGMITYYPFKTKYKVVPKGK